MASNPIGLGTEDSVSNIYNTMDYGIALDSDEAVKIWYANRGNKLGCFINNKWISEKDRKCIEIGHLSNKVPITKIVPNSDDVNNSVESAHNAFLKWSQLSGHERARYLYNIARNIQKHQNLMGLLESVQLERPVYHARNFSVPNLIRSFYHYAGWAEMFDSEMIHRKAIGVVLLGVHGYGKPLLSCQEVAPALASGNTVILVPDQRYCMSSILFAEICLSVGLPAGVVNVIPGDMDTINKLSVKNKINKISFSGFPEEGRKLQRKVAGLSKNISIEINGRPIVIIFDSADVDSAVEGIVETLLYSDIRGYCAGVKLLVQELIYSTTVNKVEKRMNKLRVGHFLDKTIDMSNICDDLNSSRTLKCLNEIKTKGAKVFVSSSFNKSSSAQPIVISNIQTPSKILEDEIGGPIIFILPFRTAAEAVSLANNNSQFCPSISIWAERHAVALEVGYQVKSNTVWINGQNMIDAATNHGTHKGGKDALLNFTVPNGQILPLPNSSDTDTFYSKDFGLKSKLSCNFQMPKEYIKEDVNIIPIVDHTYKLYYGGAQKRPDSNSSYPIYTHEKKLLAYIPDSNRKDVRNAVEAAHAVLPGWKKKNGYNRSQILYYVAENLELRMNEFSNRLSELTGNPLEKSKAEVQFAIQKIFHSAALCDKCKGTVQETLINGTVFQVVEPIGVIGIICPNDVENPFLSFISLLLAAISVGNTAVIVPSENYPLPALDMYQIFDTSDIPKGVINILSGDQDHLTKCLVEHQNVQGVWYHDNSIKGAAFVEYTASNNFKRVWIGYGPKFDWKNFDFSQDEDVYQHGSKQKCIWLPMGDIFP